jgi:large exoprotein involved in heme utilization and adhesion
VRLDDPRMDISDFARRGTIAISQSGLLSVNGLGAGTIILRSGRLMIDGSIVRALTLGNLDGAETGIDIDVERDFAMTGGGLIEAGTGGSGQSGNIVVRAGRVTLTEGARLQTVTASSAAGGNITIRATEAVSFAGDNSGITSGMITFTNSSAPAGHITIAAPAAEITLQRGTIFSLGSVFGGATGNIRVTGKNLTLSESGTIANLNLNGPAGTIEIVARNTISIVGDNRSGAVSGLGSFALDGEPGVISVRASTLTLDRGVIGAPALLPNAGDGRGGEVMIEVGTLSARNSTISSSTATDGASGNVTVRARESILLTGGTEISSSTLGSGSGGTVLVQATAVSAAEGSRIESNTSGSGPGGSVTVTVGSLTLSSGAQISSSSSGAGQGGRITVTATDTATFTGSNPERLSGIFAQTSGQEVGSGTAGAIVLRAQDVVLTDGAQINSGSLGTGQGGTVTVMATDTVTLGGTALGNAAPSAIFAQAEGRGVVAGNAGTVVVEARRIGMTEGVQIGTSTFGNGDGGALRVIATEAITITGLGSQAPQTGLFSVTDGNGDAGPLFVSAPTLGIAGGRILGRTLGGGDAGSIEVRVGRLTLAEGAQIFNGTGNFVSGGAIGIDGPGRGGNLTVVATDSVTIAGSDAAGFASGLFSNAQFGRGRAGNLTVSTPRLEMSAGGFIGVESLRSSRGDAGNLTVEVGTLVLREGAQISGTTTGQGQGGIVTVSATTAIEISGQDSFGNQSGVFSTTGDTRPEAGDAGDVFVSAPILTMRQGAQLSTSTAGRGIAGDVVVEVDTLTLTQGAQINSRAIRAGRGGTITVTAADTVAITGQDSGLFTSAQGRGRGGDLTLRAGRLQLAEGAVISAESTAAGSDAGSITITTRESFISDRGTVTTEARQADGGDIHITAPLLLRLRDSAITATVGGGAETVGGNLTVESEFVILEGSQVIANAFAGRGGSIDITADVFLADPTSQVTASSTLGIDGQVNIRAPVNNLSGVTMPLPPDFAQAVALLRDRCAARLRRGTVSTLVERGRDGVPATPGGALPTRLVRSNPAVATPAAQQPGGLYRDAMGQLQLSNWPVLAISSPEQEVECPTHSERDTPPDWRGN